MRSYSFGVILLLSCCHTLFEEVSLFPYHIPTWFKVIANYWRPLTGTDVPCFENRIFAADEMLGSTSGLRASPDPAGIVVQIRSLFESGG